jgi:hypothetical protein
MQELYLDLDEFKDGVIVFGQETFMISRFVDSSKSYFSQASEFGPKLSYHLRNNAQLKIDIHNKEHSNWFDKTGIPCSILSPDTDGWQSGKVRLNLQVTVEFYPDNPEPFDFEEEHQGKGSPLDDLCGIGESV